MKYEYGYEYYYDVECACKWPDGSKKISKVWHTIRDHDEERELSKCPTCGEDRKIKKKYKRTIEENEIKLDEEIS